MSLLKPHGEQPNRSNRPEPSAELIKPPKRIVIFGTSEDHAIEMAETFEEFLKERGILDTAVEYCKQISQIEPAFFNNGNEPCAGVVILPTMRAEMPSGMGMTADTPVEYILRLCQENGVPFVDLSKSQQSGDIQTSILQLSS